MKVAQIVVRKLDLPLIKPYKVSEIDRQVAHGFKALKVKGGFDFVQDVRRVTAIQRAANGRARITLPTICSPIHCATSTARSGCRRVFGLKSTEKS